MKVRVIENPLGGWKVETRDWVLFIPCWQFNNAFLGPDAKNLAIAYAKKLKNPEIVEI